MVTRHVVTRHERYDMVKEIEEELKAQQENCATISSPSHCSVTCVWCGSELKPSPTDKWWVKKNAHEGLCYDCIVNSMRNVICGLDADKSPNAGTQRRTA